MGAAERWGVTRLVQRVGGGHDPRLYVLAYHRVVEPNHDEGASLDLVSASPAQFDEQMRMIAREYHPVSAEDAMDAVESGRPLPRDAVLVTVDDGYRDFQDFVFPIARRHGIRPVLFVPTAFVGGGEFWWDRLYRALQCTRATEIETPLGRLPIGTAVERDQAWSELAGHVRHRPFEEAHDEIRLLCEAIDPEPRRTERMTLDWDELRALSRAGATIAAHSHTHPILSHVPLDRARQEICESQAAIAREIGHALPIFAYPDGRRHALSEALPGLLHEAGFRLAFTMIEGRARLLQDQALCLPRLSASRRHGLAQFHLHLTPAYDGWKRLKR